MNTRLLIAGCVLALWVTPSQAGQGVAKSQRLTISKLSSLKTKKLKQRRIAKVLGPSQEIAGGG